MHLHEHFLPKDLEQASKEYKCFKDCLEIITKNVNKGQVEKAKHHATDMIKSLHELSKLSYKKKEVETRNEIMNLMGLAGIDTQVHRVSLHDR